MSKIVICEYCEIPYWDDTPHECAPDHLKERITALCDEVYELHTELDEEPQ
jgi:hypothetical protein